MKNNAILGALAMDLKRAAIGLNRGSNKMAERFLKEALKRRDEIDVNSVKPYIAKFLLKIDKLQTQKIKGRVAEDALLYSTIFQNASQV